jgi:hypothetical protein
MVTATNDNRSGMAVHELLHQERCADSERTSTDLAQEGGRVVTRVHDHPRPPAAQESDRDWHSRQIDAIHEVGVQGPSSRYQTSGRLQAAV